MTEAPDTIAPAAPKPKRKAIDRTAGTALDAARRTAEAAEANPLAILAGGIALGVIAGALIPRSEQEAKLLAPVGRRLADTASGAALAAKDAGKAEFDALGLSKQAARAQVAKLLNGVLQALSSAGTAAAQSAKGSGSPKA